MRVIRNLILSEFSALNASNRASPLKLSRKYRRLAIYHLLLIIIVLVVLRQLKLE